MYVSRSPLTYTCEISWVHNERLDGHGSLITTSVQGGIAFLIDRMGMLAKNTDVTLRAEFASASLSSVADIN